MMMGGSRAWRQRVWRRQGVLTLGFLVLLGWLVAHPALAEPPGATAPPAVTEPVTAPVVTIPAAAVPAAAKTGTVKVGLFITQLYDLDMPRRSFNATFWAWFLHNEEAYKPVDTVEIVNAKTSTLRFPSVTPEYNIPWQTGNSRVFWTQGKYAATLSQDFDVTKFPFDRQTLLIMIEDAQNDVDQTIFLADSDNSKIDKAVKIPGWQIESFNIQSGHAVYDTTYGDPSLQGSSTYSRVTASIVVKRDGLRLLGSMFIGFFVAFALTFLTYFLDTEFMAGSRIGLCGGAIFASVGNKFVVDTSLPPASTFTLSDAIEASTFCAIVMAILIVVLVRATQSQRPRLAKWINAGGAVLSASSYLTYNSLMIFQAMK